MANKSTALPMNLEHYHHASSSSAVMTRHDQRHRLASSPCHPESMPVEKHGGHASGHQGFISEEASGSLCSGWCRFTANANARTSTSTNTIRQFGCWWILLPLVTGVLSLVRILEQNGNYCSFCRSVVPASFPYQNKKQDQFQSSLTSCDCFLRSGKPSNTRGHNNDPVDDNDEDCCERIIWRTHKFGTVLLGDLFANFRRRDNHNNDIHNATIFRIQTRPTPQSINYTLPPSHRDYRHVLVTRNWREAMVSGYLYHRSGYECTIDFRGTASRHSKHFDMERHYHHKLWDTPKYLTYHSQHNMSFPPRHNRSLCEYLAQESESVGMAIVVDLALSRWYKGVVAYHQMASANAPNNQTLLLCFEDLVDPFQQERIYYQILNFLFPTTNDNNKTKIDWTTTAPMPGAMKHALVQQQQQQQPAPFPNLNQSQHQPLSSSKNNNSNNYYEGGHASSHDPQLRARLRSLVEYWDQSLFQGAVAKSNAIFQCGR